MRVYVSLVLFNLSDTLWEAGKSRSDGYPLLKRMCVNKFLCQTRIKEDMGHAPDWPNSI